MAECMVCRVYVWWVYGECMVSVLGVCGSVYDRVYGVCVAECMAACMAACMVCVWQRVWQRVWCTS